MLASATIVGNIGKKVELKDFAGGKFAKFSVATNSWDKENGKKTTWFDVVCWNTKLSEFLGTYGSSGSKIYVQGELVKRTYTKDGQDKIAVEVVVGRFNGSILLLGKSELVQTEADSTLDSDNTSDLEDIPF